MGYRFNPPPNWPAPPPGWVPPPGWRPSPEWPAPPPGWQLWIDDTAQTGAKYQSKAARSKTPWSMRKKVTIAAVVLVCAAAVIAGMISGARQSLASKPAAATSAAPLTVPSVSAAPARRTAAKKPSPAVEPTFAYPGNSQCAIVYRDDGNGTMSWTATVTVAGELITHASDSAGNIYRHDVQVISGPNAFTAPVPLSKIDDIGGVLYAGNSSYGCSIAPQGASTAPTRTVPAAIPAPIASTPQAAPAAPTGCHPLTNGGNCYEPGEYCRTADQGTSGLAGDGESISCEYNNGWRWEPS
jgi:hypothetical protein